MRFLFAVLLAGCTSLEPTVGALQTERTNPDPPVDVPDSQEPTSDAANASDDASDAASDAVRPTPDGDATSPPKPDAPAPAGVSFRRDIRPMFNRAANDPNGKGCRNCHYSTEVNHQGIDLGGMDLATLGATREGGGSTGRRIIVPGKPEESGLVQKLRGTYPFGTRMPKNGPAFWSDADIKIVADWIAEGARGADDE